MTHPTSTPAESGARSPNPFCRHLIDCQEKERAFLAREMHDSLGQYLLRIRQLALLAVKARAATRNCEEISVLAAQAINEIRRLIRGLRPEELDALGLTEAVLAMIDTMAHASSMRFNVDVDKVDGLLAPSAEINLFRVVQEALSNIVKHSGASSVYIAIKRQPRGLCLTVRDNGVGFDVASYALAQIPEEGFGLCSMTERIRILGGELEVTSQPQCGTTLKATIPLAS